MVAEGFSATCAERAARYLPDERAGQSGVGEGAGAFLVRQGGDKEVNSSQPLIGHTLDFSGFLGSVHGDGFISGRRLERSWRGRGASPRLCGGLCRIAGFSRKHGRAFRE